MPRHPRSPDGPPFPGADVGPTLLEAATRVAEARGWPSAADVGELAPALVELSRRYNLEGTDALLDAAPGATAKGGPEARALRAARLAFSLPRDAAKAAAAVRELGAAGLLRVPGDRPFRLLDVGAGLGAMTFGVHAALGAEGGGAVHADLVDHDAAALELAGAVAKELARAEAPGPALRLAPRTTRVTGRVGQGPYDLVIAGQVLSELDRELDAAARVARHAALLLELARELRPDGALVVVEPALRDRTRHLHAVRDALLGSALAPFAPCVHRAACPALAREGDWCHEDLAVDLPEGARALARGAGLRWEGLTFAYLVLRRDGVSLGDVAGRGPGLARIVSSPIVTKGKRELVLCGELATGPGRAKVRRLDRERSPSNEAWDALGRGDLVRVDPAPADGARLGPDAGVAPVAVGAVVDVADEEGLQASAMRGLYVIVDTVSLARRGVDPVAFAEAALEASPCALQLRAKDLPPRETLGLLRRLVPPCRERGVPLVANDRPDLAALGGADLVHVGQTDTPAPQVRGLAPGLGVGVSTHDLDQLAEALAASPTYVAFGPVFGTTSKAAPDPVVGLDGLRRASTVARVAGVPLVAIGGITLELAPVVARFADAAAVIADLLPEDGSPEALRRVADRATRLHAALSGSAQGGAAPGASSGRLPAAPAVPGAGA